MLSPSKVALEKADYETLSTAAKKYYTQEKKVSKLQRALEAAHKTIDDLKSQIKSLKAEIASLRDELFQYKSVRNKLNTPNLEQENEHLRSKLRAYEDVISRNNMWHLFGNGRSRTHARDDAR